MIRILIIENDAQIVNLVSAGLSAEGYEVMAADTGRESLRVAFEFRPDLILLDIGLGDDEMDGWDVCEKLRSFYNGAIIMLTAREGEENKVRGLDLGADDYITKPFGQRELLARIRARLRDNTRTFNTLQYRDDHMTIDLQRRVVVRDGTRLTIPQGEFDLLASFVRHLGQTMSHDQLLQETWGSDFAGEYEYLRGYIRRLRERIEDDPKNPCYIVTQRGFGYAFRPAK